MNGPVSGDQSIRGHVSDAWPAPLADTAEPASSYYFVVVAVFLTLLIGMSRVYLGVHFPTDVLGGWSAGLAWACLCWLAGRRLIPQSERSAITLR